MTLYEKCLKNGCSRKLAEMLASRSPPKAVTDSLVFGEHGSLAQQFGDDKVGEGHLRAYAKKAMRRGYKPRATDVYLPQLAEFPGDPEAWVSPTDGRAQIRKVLAKKGLTGRGGVLGTDVSRPKYYEPPPPVALSEKIINDEIKQRVRKDPNLKRKKRAELREQIIHECGPKKK